MRLQTCTRKAYENCRRGFTEFSHNATNGPDILRIVEEDIMRILYERSKQTSLKALEDEIKVAHRIIVRALEELERTSLIAIQDDLILLTALGKKSAKDICKKHSVIESYFGRTRSKIDAHITAHILEHYVSGEVVNNIKKLATLKIKGCPLTEFQPNRLGIITDIALSDYRLFERVVSMGIFLGEKVMITSRIPQGLVIKMKNKKFALDRQFAEAIKAVEYAHAYETP